MKMFELLPRPLGSIFRKLTHLTCNSRSPVRGKSAAYLNIESNYYINATISISSDPSDATGDSPENPPRDGSPGDRPIGDAASSRVNM